MGYERRAMKSQSQYPWTGPSNGQWFMKIVRLSRLAIAKVVKPLVVTVWSLSLAGGWLICATTGSAVSHLGIHRVMRSTLTMVDLKLRGKASQYIDCRILDSTGANL